jgi:hypothetical protein
MPPDYRGNALDQSRSRLDAAALRTRGNASDLATRHLGMPIAEESPVESLGVTVPGIRSPLAMCVVAIQPAHQPSPKAIDAPHPCPYKPPLATGRPYRRTRRHACKGPPRKVAGHRVFGE